MLPELKPLTVKGGLRSTDKHQKQANNHSNITKKYKSN